MNIIVNLATYPAREEVFHHSIESVYNQVDQINLVLNEYRYIPKKLAKYGHVNPIIPEYDLKDVGKFYPITYSDDFMFLCDDDIIYPADYVETMLSIYEQYSHYNPILGLHGCVYSDFFEGLHKSRLVHVFHHALDKHRLVNQLGTGTVVCKGSQMPRFEFMESSQKFVDLRFAVHAYNKHYPMVCVKRDKDWLTAISTDETIFENFTQYWPKELIQEVQQIAGFSKIDANLLPVFEH